MNQPPDHAISNTENVDGGGNAGLGKSLDAGTNYLRDQLKRLPQGPGVYRMLDRRSDALYVGKAKNIRKRVTSYTKPTKLPERLRRMVAETTLLEVVSTHTEVEALLLESNLIKRLRPRYNILLRDDKSFPYIHIGEGDFSAEPKSPSRWPRIVKYRGKRNKPGTYYGPFASAGSVNRTLNALERAFLLRSCTDSAFASRTRPCLLHQIKRCSAPCVERISPKDYASLVQQADDFLSGRNTEVHKQFAEAMEAASADLEFETAAYFRDRIQALAHVQSHQDINLPMLDEADVVAIWQQGGSTCIEVFFFRGGRNYGNWPYFPRHEATAKPGDILAAFVNQFYENKPPPKLVLLSEPIPDTELVSDALAVKAGHKVDVAVPRRGEKRKLIDHALVNAKSALARRLSESASQRRLLDEAADAFDLDSSPERIEVYDNSHISGTNPIGAMIVAGPEGFIKGAYRKFNIKSKDITPGDDFGMMREVLTRRYTRALKEDPEREQGQWPDLVIIDGGRGQLNAVLEVLQEIGVDDIPVVGMSKGPDRDAGLEVFHLPDGRSFSLEKSAPLLYFLQRLRDEAHRFAIGTHRARRAKSQMRSAIDDISGVGARRKRALLNHFGSVRNIEQAGIADLEAVDGVSKTVAKQIYEHFHEES